MQTDGVADSETDRTVAVWRNRTPNLRAKPTQSRSTQSPQRLQLTLILQLRSCKNGTEFFNHLFKNIYKTLNQSKLRYDYVSIMNEDRGWDRTDINLVALC